MNFIAFLANQMKHQNPKTGKYITFALTNPLPKEIMKNG